MTFLRLPISVPISSFSRQTGMNKKTFGIYRFVEFTKNKNFTLNQFNGFHFQQFQPISKNRFEIPKSKVAFELTASHFTPFAPNSLKPFLSSIPFGQNWLPASLRLFSSENQPKSNDPTAKQIPPTETQPNQDETAHNESNVVQIETNKSQREGLIISPRTMFRYMIRYIVTLPLFSTFVNHLQVWIISGNFGLLMLAFLPIAGIVVPYYLARMIFVDPPMIHSNRFKNMLLMLLLFVIGTYLSAAIMEYAIDKQTKLLETILKQKEREDQNSWFEFRQGTPRYNPDLDVWEVAELGKHARCLGGKLILIGDDRHPKNVRDLVSLLTSGSIFSKEEKEAMIEHERGHRDTFQFFMNLETLISNISLNLMTYPMFSWRRLFLALYFHFFGITWMSWLNEYLADMRAGPRGFQVLDIINHSQCSPSNHSERCRSTGFCALRGEFGMTAHPPLSLRIHAFQQGDLYPKVLKVVHLLGWNPFYSPPTKKPIQQQRREPTRRIQIPIQ
jgi:hypothetical protein